MPVQKLSNFKEVVFGSSIRGFYSVTVEINLLFSVVCCPTLKKIYILCPPYWLIPQCWWKWPYFLERSVNLSMCFSILKYQLDPGL